MADTGDRHRRGDVRRRVDTTGEHTNTAESYTEVIPEETFAPPETEGVPVAARLFTGGSGRFNFMELDAPFISA